jgi:ribosome-associated protein
MAGIKGGMKRGYYVKGHFVAEGSEMDIELKTEQMGSKTRAKAADSAKQDLGAVLMTLPPKRWAAFDLPEILIDALTEAKRITDFEGKRRQMQYIGKLMRKVDADALAQAIELDAVAHRQPELVAPKLQRVWAEKLLDADAGAAALQQLIAEQPQADIQQLRSLLRQAKKLQTSARELQNAQPPQPDKAYAEYRAAKRAAKKLQAFIAQVLGHDEPEDDEDGEGAAA